MTNATVADVAVAPDGQHLQLTYPDGRKTIVVPPEAPVVSFRNSDRGLLAVGSAVSLTAQEINGQSTAVRISATPFHAMMPAAISAAQSSALSHPAPPMIATEIPMKAAIDVSVSLRWCCASAESAMLPTERARRCVRRVSSSLMKITTASTASVHEAGV